MSAESFVVAAPPLVSLSVDGLSARFPIRRVYCVGRNYAAHAREMGHDPDREPPFFFLKTAEDVVDASGEGAVIAYPPLTKDLHHEVELVVALGAGGSDIAAGDALRHVYGYAVGLDLTHRDVQGEAKRLGRPWATAKAFPASAPIGAIHPAARIGHPAAGRITAAVNGTIRQDGDLGEMIWDVGAIIAHLSRWFALAPGDLIFTGTPAGVGGIARGDHVEAHIAGVGALRLAVR